MAAPGHSEFVKILDNNGDVVSSFGGTVISQDDNSAFTVNTSEGVPLFGLYESSPSNLTDGRVGAIGVTQGRALRVAVEGSLPAGTNNIGDVDVASIANGSLNGPGAPAVDSYAHASINLASGTNQQLVAAPGANKQIWVYGLGFVVNAAGTVSFQDEDDTAITGVMPFAANSGLVIPPSGNFAMPIWKLATNKALEVDIATSEVDGWISYGIVDVS